MLICVCNRANKQRCACCRIGHRKESQAGAIEARLGREKGEQILPQAWKEMVE